MNISEWQPIDTAPKDGRVIVLTWLENGEPQDQFPMAWANTQRNGLFPGKFGMWATIDGGLTWNDDDPAGAPTHWKHLSPAQRTSNPQQEERG